MKLPKYIIEKVNNVWGLYSTVDCITYCFDTRLEAEDKLKILKY